ncbi:MAG: hypothetical protein EU536_01745 [Promethearchaeota archaeon]|nr:MAG: hypothetical protein EU536_01745 [Candidatus Lokiarchaeota archaeon]
MTLLSVLSIGVWSIPPPLFVLLALLLPILLYLTARTWQKGEAQYTGGAITSGGRFALLVLGACFGLLLIIGGSLSILFWWFWMPLHVGIPTLIIGLVLFIYSLWHLQEEKRKREEAGFG